MNDNTIKNIERSIGGYCFENKNLLKQAFIRRSYSNENGGENNEVLEFYGDKALEFIVVKKMSEHYGKSSKTQFFNSFYKEGKLTNIKKKIICREMLAKKVRENNLQYYLMLSEGDLRQGVMEEEAVQEDLLEAIIGAVAIDSGWDIGVIEDTVDWLLSLDYYLSKGGDDVVDYFEVVSEWHQKKYHSPLSCYVYDSTWGIGDNNLDNRSFQMGMVITEYEPLAKQKVYQCDLRLEGMRLEKHIPYNAAEKAYEYLEKHNLLFSLADEVGKPDLERAVNQLQELYQKGYIGEPEYSFRESHDSDGNPVWRCKCKVGGLELIFYAEDSSKKQAKKKAAYEAVKIYLKEEQL